MTAAVSGGQLVRVKSAPFAGARATSSRPSTWLDYPQLGLSASYGLIYASQPWVAAAVNKLARGIPRIPLKCYLREGDSTEYLTPFGPDAHELPLLLSRPFPRGSRFKLVEHAVGNVAIYGKGYWWKYRESAGAPPVELWPISARYMELMSGDDVGVEHYEYKGPAGRRKFLPDDLVVFEWWSPKGPQGTSPLEQLRETLALEHAGRRYAVSSFRHGARPSGAVTTPKTLDPKQKDELRAEIQELNSGPDQAFRIALMDGGMEWRPFAHTSQEAETIAHRKLNREEVCAVYDLPPPVLQILDRATFSNITEQNKALYRESLGPWFAMFEETIASQLIWGEYAYEGTYPEFDLSEILRADLPQRAGAYRQMETTLSMNERRKFENLPPVGDLDDDANPANGVLFPLNMAVVLPDGTVLPPSGAPPPAEPVDADQLSRDLEATLERVLAGRAVDRELVAALAGSGNGGRGVHVDVAAALPELAGQAFAAALAEANAEQLERIERLATAVERAVRLRSAEGPTTIPPQRLKRRRIVRDETGTAVGFDEEWIDESEGG